MYCDNKKHLEAQPGESIENIDSKGLLRMKLGFCTKGVHQVFQNA